MREWEISYTTRVHRDSFGRKIVYLPLKLSQLAHIHKVGDPVKVTIEGLIPEAEVDHYETSPPLKEKR